MSSRALRKLQQKTTEVDGDDDDDEVSLRTGFGGARARVGNPFDLLNNDSCSESEVKEDDDLGTESSRSATAARTTTNQIKKKKRTKNRKRKSVPHVKSSEDNLEEFEDEVERSVNEVNRLLGEAGPSEDGVRKRGNSDREPPLPASNLRALLSVEPKNLNPENEMKKIFGSKVVLAEHRHAHSRRGGGRSRAVHHKHWLVVPKSTWPHPGKTGLSMKFLDSDGEGNQHFAFEHAPPYRAVQNRFYQAVESMHPDFIVEILNANPFHVDSMLQLSEICRMGEDGQMATELVERSLYSLETAFHPLFNLAAGTSRLSYRRQENRSLFLALFRHMVNVGSRACYRTALELAKVLIGLDPDRDPLGVLLVVDFYALRANQHRWLADLDREWEAAKNLSQLPNFAYSVALAYFHLSRKDPTMEATADERLRRALIMFPSVLLPLLDKCSIEPDPEAGAHPFFLGAGTDQSPGLHILTGLYVGRSFHVWKEPHVLPWLERNVRQVLSVVDAGADGFVEECRAKRRTRYQGTPRNVYRHVIVSDVKDATAALPTELTNGPILSYDPLPPLDSIDTYRQTPGARSAGAAAGDHDNPFRLFFSSMLPNFNPADEAAIAAAAAAEAEGAAGGQRTGDLRRSVTTLLDAMQDLLGGLHLPELPNDGAASADSENEED